MDGRTKNLNYNEVSLLIQSLKLRLMFKEIQGPFMEVCPKSRKNFLNYSYVLHKFVELLSLDEYKIYFPLLMYHPLEEKKMTMT